jgi:CYTH domain-containing protein
VANPGVEIERKFLVADRPGELERSDATQIRQGYLAIGEDGSEVRVRERDGKMTLTVKRGGGRTRAEEEIELDAGEFERLWPLTEGRRLEKRRHEVPYAGVTVEVDVYGGALDGLMLAEVEFPSEQAADEFEPPVWLGRELTDDARFSSHQLALEGKPQDGYETGAG